MNNNHLITGAGYLLDGTKLVFEPRFRHFVIVPVVVNVLIFLILTALMVAYFNPAVQAIIGLLPDWKWLQPLLKAMAVVIWLAAALVAVVVYGYSFSLITNILAAPFYGLLAEKIEEHLTGQAPPPESIATMIVRTMGRELVKLWYFVSRGLLVLIVAFILGFIPLANFFVPVILALWAAWSMSIQYVDYPADNYRLKFGLFRRAMGQGRYSAWGFGGLTLLGLMVPVLNILVAPAAVAGGTLFWLQELTNQPEVEQFKARLRR
ncbi:sulfate transporter CysZ [Halioxenophilus sp. WMMB6]|uniref:sulfate transporter CysZ n=1 Tax=Halioxenophilus sp. WMMB6 TaxID=3073815 RepID=UPI00295E9546|nr:sulfate transporter CysZ [Halioxenophilus sp. WMMB6]